MTDVINKVQKKGSELLKERVRVTLDFVVTADDGKIQRSGNDEEVKQFDLALLKQFLIADSKRLKEMLIYQIALHMSWCNAEDIEEWLMGSIMDAHYEHRLFSPAIEQLTGFIGDYWRELRDSRPVKGMGSPLGMCTEDIFECFGVHYLQSHVAVIKEEESDE